MSIRPRSNELTDKHHDALFATFERNFYYQPEFIAVPSTL